MILTALPNGNTIATIEGDTHIGKWAIESGRLDHDQNTLPLLAPLIPPGGTVVDVGAYIGDHTVFYAARVADAGSVFAFEPNPEAFKCLAFNVRHLSQVKPLNVGASNKAHEIGLAIDTNGGAAHATSEGNIPCITIDSLNLSACHFIKLDCEGMEPLALHGARETIMTHRPSMLIEVNEGALTRQGFNPATIFAILKHYGYAYRNIYEAQPMEGDQYDILCLPIPSA